MDDIDAKLLALMTNDVGFVKVLRELVARMAMLTIWISDQQPVESSEIDEMLKGLDELHALMARISEFLPPVE